MSFVMRQTCSLARARCGNRILSQSKRHVSYQSTTPTVTPTSHSDTPAYNPNTFNQSANQSNNPSDETHFGFTSIPTSQKVHAVADVFNRVASRYDLMNDLMSAGIHRVWKHRLIDKLNAQPNMRLIDVAGGTGDIAFRYIEEMHRLHGKNVNGSVTVCDINPNMLAVGQQRAIDAGYLNNSSVNPAVHTDFQEGNAECLPFPDETFDAYTIAFGLRNVTHIDKALRDAHRVLKKGGHLMVMEFSTLPNPVLNKLYDMYSFNVIPLLGQIAANDRDSYQYLVESIRKFPVADDLIEKLNQAGFKHTRYERLSQGIVCIHEGFKL